MSNRMNLIPSQYRFAVDDFYKDDDGWWIILKQNGPYILSGYYAEYTIHEGTQKEALNEFRRCVQRKEA